MKRNYLYIFMLMLSFAALIYITVEKFNDIKTQYKIIEPNLENYSVAEVLFLSFERMKISLLSPESNDDFLIKKKIFDSKIRIIENKSIDKESFFYDRDFLSAIEKLKQKSNALSIYYSSSPEDKNRQERAVWYIKDMHATLLDLQEIGYRIQLSNFNKIKSIIEDNSFDAALYSLLCIALTFILIALLWRHITRLKSSLLEKNVFISAIYHELSSSVQKIQFSSEMIDFNNERVITDKYINSIKLHSNKIFNQIREILEYSKIEIGRMEITNSTFYITDLIDEISSSCEEEMRNDFIIKVNSVERLIRSDKQKLTSIMVNLVDNANKNTQDGTICLTVKLLKSNLYIRVKDNGCGFDISRLQTLYRPFNQGAENETRQGLGLGLTIIKSYVKMFDGKISVKSRPGLGSSFLISVPVSLVSGD